MSCCCFSSFVVLQVFLREALDVLSREKEALEARVLEQEDVIARLRKENEVKAAIPGELVGLLLFGLVFFLCVVLLMC